MAVKRLLDGRFQLLRVISSKSYSKTYLMTDHSDPAKAKCIVKHLQLPSRNPVTLKFLHDLLVKRAKILQRLGDHPALAKQLACIQEGGDFYWVRSYVPGQPLQAELAIHQPKPEPEVRRLLTEVLSCLEVLQHHGVVHQNLHPNNLIRHQGDSHLVAVDFSLAQEDSHLKTEANDNGNGASPAADVQAVYLPQVPHRQYPNFNADHFALGMIVLQYATGLTVEALPQLHQQDFLEQFRLQLDEVATLSEATKQILVGLVSPQGHPDFSQAKAILARLTMAPTNAIHNSAAHISVPQPDKSIQPHRTKPARSMHAPKTTPSGATSQPSKWWLGLIAVPVLLIGGGILFQVPQRLMVTHWFRQAAQAQEQGQINEAVNYLNQIISRHPNHASALVNRSSMLWENGDSDQALQDITTAIQTGGNNPEWYFQRGNIRLHVGDLQGAIADYTDALRLDENFSKVYVNRGSARAEMGDEAGAVQDYSAALAVAKDPDIKASAFQNRCLSLSNLEDDATALADCTEAVNLQPNNSFAYQNRGLVKRRLRDFQGALQDFTIAIQIDPSNPDPYYNRALARQDLGDLSGAMEDFNQAINLDPEHPFAYYDRGLLNAELGNQAQAIADLNRVASVCLEVGRVGCFEDAQFQLNELGVGTP